MNSKQFDDNINSVNQFLPRPNQVFIYFFTHLKIYGHVS